MGVHELWSILGPVCESVPLYSLAGRTLAVDLSLWVCEAQHVQAMMGKVTKPHLRNLFFRVTSLTLMGVKLVFVMEGEAPKIKADTMNKRTEMRFGGFKSSAPKSSANRSTNRSRFKAILRECAEMLDYLGLPWVTAAGEAEAMCAFLDSHGFVDGCITNDGDAFLYGAKTVYRNFNMTTKDPQVDCYKMARVEAELHLPRETLVGLAILLGCDYLPKGITGVGKEQTLKLIQRLKGQTLLQKFREWKSVGMEAGAQEVAVKKMAHCHVCRHPGSAKSHERSGCVFCDSKHFCQPQDYDSQCPCDWHRTEHARQASSLETNIRRRILANEKFPFTEIINEFLLTKDKPVENLRRRKPNILSIQNFALDKMEWPKAYTSEKVLPLITYTELMSRKYGRESSAQIQPIRVHKPRVRNGIACFEVVWTRPDHFVFPDDHVMEEQNVVRTVEEEALFSVAYPHIVQQFHIEKAEAQENKTKKKKPRPKLEKTADAFDSVSDLLAQMSIQQSAQTAPSSTEAFSSKASLSNTSSAAVLPANVPKPRPGLNDAHLHQTAPDGTVATPSSPSSPEHVAEAKASPSVSAMIEELHLSGIDWEASSFTTSPSAQAHSAKTDPRPVQCREEPAKAPSSGSATEVGPAVCPSESSLRERVLMRNGLRSVDLLRAHVDDVTKPVSQPVAVPARASSAEQLHTQQRKAPLLDQNQRVGDRELRAEAMGSKTNRTTSTSQRAKARHGTQSKLPHKDQFIKTKIVTATEGLPQRCSSDPGSRLDPKQGVRQVGKMSVCLSLVSSSEDSDTENRQQTRHRRPKAKARELRPLNTASLTKTRGREQAVCCESEDGVTHTMQTKVLTSEMVITEQDDVFLPDRVSPVGIERSDSSDSDVCDDSPRPLAERLRVKFAK